MEIIWDYEALDDLEAIFCYMENHYTIYEVQRFRKELINSLKNLSDFPNCGKVELSLKDCVDKKVRYITVDKRCKLIYFFMQENIFIVALWNTLRDRDTLVLRKRGPKPKNL